MKFRANFAVLLIVVSSFLVSACSTVTYNGVGYSSTAEALQAQDRDFLKLAEKISPLEKPMLTKAMLVIPDKIAIGDKGIIKGRLASPDAVDYVSTVTYRYNRYLKEALLKRNIFSQIDIFETADTEGYALEKIKDYPVVVYYKLVNPTQQGWYLLGKDNEKIPFTFDARLPAGNERFISLITALERELQKLK